MGNESPFDVQKSNSEGTKVMSATGSVQERWELLKALPGAAKAVADVVGEFGRQGAEWLHVSTAKARQVSGRIEAQTRAEAKVIEARAGAEVAKIEVMSENIVARAKQHRLSQEVKNQKNRESVAQIALENLMLDPPAVSPKDEPSDDWLNLFSAYAERASSETMRQHWGRILEAEIRRPSAFSFAALQLAALLDRQLAESITKISKYVVSGSFIPVFEELSSGPLFQDILNLVSVGFMNLAQGSLSIELDNDAGEFELDIYKFAINKAEYLFNPNVERKNGKTIVNMPIYFLTVAGIEVLSIVDVKSIENFPDKIIALFARFQMEIRYIGPSTSST